MAGSAPAIGWPTAPAGFWFQKMARTVVTRNSDNATDAVEQALDQCIIPIGIMSNNSVLRVRALVSCSNNGGTGTTKTFAFRMDTSPASTPSSSGIAMFTQNQSTNIAGSLTTVAAFGGSSGLEYMQNGATSFGGAFNANAILNRTVDFNVERTITFCASWAINQAVAQSITLNGWLVEVFQ